MADEEDYSELDEEVKKTKESKEATSIITKKELLKGENRKIVNILGKQGDLLKKFKESEEFFSGVGLSQSNIYFKIRLHKFLYKFPKLKKSTLTCSYF